jgi:hypothetical protein
MGSAISSCIAQLVLETLENEIIPKLKFQLPFFYRYVYDCITAIPKGEENYILSAFQNYHNSIKFTIELENNNSINFLDLTLYHKNNKIKTQWYTKSTWSGRYLNYFSNHAMSQKKSVIIGIADRAIKLSDITFRHEAIKKAKNILINNSYPPKLINSIFSSRIQKHTNLTQNIPIENIQTQNKTKNNYLTLPYMNGLSENFQHLFKNYNISVSHKANNLLKQQYTKLKSKTPKLKKTHTIYKIPCTNCNKVYIGQTSQYLENRINGHKYDKRNKTALTRHELEFKHAFGFNNIEILKTEQNQQKREFLEMIFIKKNENAINSKTDIQKLSKLYHSIQIKHINVTTILN